MPAKRGEIPDWAARERQADLAWIAANLAAFESAASAGFEREGRGAIVVDTTVQPTRQGHPYGYFDQRFIEEHEDDPNILRLVRQHKPATECVVILLKKGDKTSAYRVRLPTYG